MNGMIQCADETGSRCVESIDNAGTAPATVGESRFCWESLGNAREDAVVGCDGPITPLASPETGLFQGVWRRGGR